MHIQRETPDNNTIRSYLDNQITIGEINYTTSLFVSKTTISSWPIRSIEGLNKSLLTPIIALKPEVIIIGHNQKPQIPIDILQYLSRQRVGVECMSVGAACRTFNVLLAEERNVVLGLIL